MERREMEMEGRRRRRRRRWREGEGRRRERDLCKFLGSNHQEAIPPPPISKMGRRENVMKGKWREKGKRRIQFFRYIHRFQLPGSHSTSTDLAKWREGRTRWRGRGREKERGGRGREKDLYTFFRKPLHLH
jgi:hypothetical protein